MLNFLSVSSVVGIFVTAVNLMCAYTPSTIIDLLNMSDKL